MNKLVKFLNFENFDNVNDANSNFIRKFMEVIDKSISVMKAQRTDTLVQPRKFITTLLFIRNDIDLFIKIQVSYILCYCCYLFILLIKWILQYFCEFQRRETLATNRTVDNNNKKKQGKEVQRRTLKQIAFLQLIWIHQNIFKYYLIACKTLRKVLRRYMKCRKRLKTLKSKVNCNSKI